MLRVTFAAVICATILSFAVEVNVANAQEGYAKNWSRTYNAQDWQRFYHYPYVYYPQNYWSQDYYRSSDNIYQRYPAEMQIPAYNKANYNYFPETKKYYQGNHFRLDIF
ncbi:MAG: hypothetical protein LBU65_08845 [Planctomycetaceae bacterium]|jgi:hypothetical protein|nr:hypothetical protein [Planctomycetaceae bacterium]